MLSTAQLAEVVKKGKEESKVRKFTESVEVILTLMEIDIKKVDLSINEIVYLPHPPARPLEICFVGSGDLALRAKNAGADLVLSPGQLENYAGSKKDAKKLVREFDFFLADTALMPRIGKILGQFLGPKGKIPTPVASNAPVETMIQRMRTAVRVRSRGSLSVAARVGDKNLSDSDIAENILAVVQAVQKKLPAGERNIKSVIIKTTMGKPVKQAVQRT